MSRLSCSETVVRRATRIPLAVVLAGVGFLASSAIARSLEDKEKAELAATVKDFDAAMSGSNYGRVVETIPPKVLKSIAAKGGLGVDQLKKSMIEQMTTLLKSAKIESFGMDLPTADYKELKDGTPYALIPTTTIVNIEGKRIKAKSQTLALIDDGKWFLVRVSEAAQLLILREVYPEFSDVEFQSGTMEVLNK